MTLVAFTLYELFGYVFPGATAMAGVYLIYWTFLLPDNQDWSTLTSWGWCALLAVAYISGHSLQAITNLVMKIGDWIIPERYRFSFVPAKIQSAVTSKACKAVVLEGKEELKKKDIYDIADHTILQRGKTETRDIYVYREGFYRGMTPGLLLFAVGCFIRITNSNVSFEVFGVSLVITERTLFWTGCIAVVMMCLSFMRYLRFARYRVKYAFYSFLTIGNTPGDDGEQ